MNHDPSMGWLCQWIGCPIELFLAQTPHEQLWSKLKSGDLVTWGFLIAVLIGAVVWPAMQHLRRKSGP